MSFGLDFEEGDFDFSWRPLDIVDIAEDARNAALNEVCLAAIRIVLPTPEQVALYQDLMTQVPGVAMTVMPMPGVSGAELVNVAFGKYLVVRAIVVSKVCMHGRAPYAQSRIVQMRTCLTNFL